ncbi:DUF2752 domain-containing protein [Pseudoxanthomonas sp.]|uniref:DUF2752 domain-containing protein n=1 Tax=Pseudoxanthomonas sp. TaxID=1871049 RepID=UPI0031F327E4
MIALTRPRVALLAATIPMVAAGAWVLRHVDPNLPNNLLPKCVFHSVTGYWCPGCGMTRALHALVHGDVLTALHMNPLGMLMLPALPAMLFWSWGWQPRVLQPVMRWLMDPRVWLAVIPAYWLLRNLPWFPFTLLAPPGSP